MMIDKDTLYSSAAQACDLLKCLANPHRLMVVCHLMDGRKSVGELAELVGIGQSNASRHLSQLRLHGILATEREAQTIYYRIHSKAAQEVLGVLYSHFCSVSDHGQQKQEGKRSC